MTNSSQIQVTKNIHIIIYIQTTICDKTGIQLIIGVAIIDNQKVVIKNQTINLITKYIIIFIFGY